MRLARDTYSVDDSILKSLDEPQREQVRRHCVFLLMLREEEVRGSCWWREELRGGLA